MNTIDMRLARLRNGIGGGVSQRSHDAALVKAARQAAVEPRILATAEEIIHFAETAAHGAKLAYCTGFVAADRADPCTAKPITVAQLTANALAGLVWSLYEAGKVTLVQRRLGDGHYSYEMQKRLVPLERRTHAGPVE